MTGNQKIMERDYILKKIDHMKDIPTIPVMLFKVNEMLKDEDCSTKELSKIIETDQAMAAKILRLVNSAFYGFRSKISNMSQALMILGFNTVRNAIITISVIDLVGIQDKLNEFNIKEFWHHAVSVAVIGKYLAAKTRKVTPEDAFVAGLLHDIGKIIMLHNFPDHSLDVLEMMYCDGISFIEAEKKISSVTHAQIGGHLARKWQFSKQQVDAIRLHHSMNLNATDPCLHVIIYLANLIAQNKIHGVLIETDFASRYPDFSKAICQYRDNISEWLPEVTREIEEACGFFIESDN